MNEKLQRAKQFYARHETKVKVGAGVLATLALTRFVANREDRAMLAHRLAYIEHEEAWAIANPEKQDQLRETWVAYKNVCDENNLKYFLD